MRQDDIENFPAKIVSRLAGGARNTNLAKIVNDPGRERHEDEAQQRIDYLDGNIISLSYSEEGDWLYVEVNSDYRGIFANKDEIDDLMKEPERLSVDSRIRRNRRKYSRHVSDGRVVSHGYSYGEQVTVGFRVQNVKNRDDIFEAFWFKLRPLLKYIKDAESPDTSS